MSESNYRKIIKDIGGVIEHIPIVNGLRVVPTAATLTIKDSNDQDLLTPVIDAAATIGSDGTLTFIVTAANADKQENGYRAKFKFTFTDIFFRDEFYDSVLAVNYLKLDEGVVKMELPRLYNKDLGQYNWNEMIVHCFREHLERDARNRGRLLHLLSRPEDYRTALLYKILETITNDLIEEPDDKWVDQRDRYERLYRSEVELGVFAQDVDDDNVMDEGENLLTSRRTRVIR